MNIKSCSNCNFFYKTIPYFLSQYKTKIFVVVAAAFALLTAVFLATRSRKIITIKKLSLTKFESACRDSVTKQNSKKIPLEQTFSDFPNSGRILDTQTDEVPLKESERLKKQQERIESIAKREKVAVDSVLGTTNTEEGKQFLQEHKQMIDTVVGAFSNLIVMNEDRKKMIQSRIDRCLEKLKYHQELFETTQQKMSKLKEEIDESQKNIEHLQNEIAQMSRGNSLSYPLAQFSFQPEDEIELENKVKIKAKDFTGTLTHDLTIKDNEPFRLLTEEEAKTFDPKGQNIAVMRGNRYEFCSVKFFKEEKATVCRIKTHWKKNEKFPWIKLCHFAENKEIYRAVIINTQGAITRLQQSIEYSKRHLEASINRLNQDKKEITICEKELELAKKELETL